MKTIVYITQHENWEDDGGSHDPSMKQVSDELFADLEKAEACIPSINDYPLKDLEALPAVEHTDLPCMVDAVFNFWYAY